MQFRFPKFPICLIAITLISGCTSLGNVNKEVTFVASRGSRPPAQTVVWSSADEDMVLITAYETPTEPAKVYILDLKTRQEDILAEQLPGHFLEAKWAPDGKHVFILAENNTKGFEPSGWWMVDIADKSSEYLISPSDAAWSPDGKTIAVLKKQKDGVNVDRIELLLIDVDTKTEEMVANYEGADSSWGLSWSADSRYVVFSLGKIRSSNLYVLNVGTLEVTQVTDNDGSKHPTWSPTGNVIAYERNSPDNIAKTYLHLINLDGGCDVEIPRLENVWSPTWSPDGTKLAYMTTDGIYLLEIEKVFERNIYESLCE